MKNELSYWPCILHGCHTLPPASPMGTPCKKYRRTSRRKFRLSCSGRSKKPFCFVSSFSLGLAGGMLSRLKSCRPIKRSLASTESSQQKGELYEYPGKYKTRDEGKRYAGIRLEEQEAQIISADGTSNCLGFECGYAFTLGVTARAAPCGTPLSMFM